MPDVRRNAEKRNLPEGHEIQLEKRDTAEEDPCFLLPSEMLPHDKSDLPGQLYAFERKRFLNLF